MTTPGFGNAKRAHDKPDGTRERIEFSQSNDALKKYTPPQGEPYSAVQSGNQKYPEYAIQSKNLDALQGFRLVFGKD